MPETSSKEATSHVLPNQPATRIEAAVLIYDYAIRRSIPRLILLRHSMAAIQRFTAFLSYTEKQAKFLPNAFALLSDDHRLQAVWENIRSSAASDLPVIELYFELAQAASAHFPDDWIYKWRGVRLYYFDHVHQKIHNTFHDICSQENLNPVKILGGHYGMLPIDCDSNPYDEIQLELFAEIDRQADANRFRAEKYIKMREKESDSQGAVTDTGIRLKLSQGEERFISKQELDLEHMDDRPTKSLPLLENISQDIINVLLKEEKENKRGLFISEINDAMLQDDIPENTQIRRYVAILKKHGIIEYSRPYGHWVTGKPLGERSLQPRKKLRSPSRR